MNSIKQSRWVRIVEDVSECEDDENIMYIEIGDENYRVKAIYTVRSYEKVAYWLMKYLETADLKKSIEKEVNQFLESVKDISKNTPQIKIKFDTWFCEIHRLAPGIFQTYVLLKRKDQNYGIRKTCRESQRKYRKSP